MLIININNDLILAQNLNLLTGNFLLMITIIIYFIKLKYFYYIAYRLYIKPLYFINLINVYVY